MLDHTVAVPLAPALQRVVGHRVLIRMLTVPGTSTACMAGLTARTLPAGTGPAQQPLRPFRSTSPSFRTRR